MNGLENDRALLGRACRIFLDLAYPGGEETIPVKRPALPIVTCPLTGPWKSSCLPPPPPAVSASC